MESSSNMINIHINTYGNKVIRHTLPSYIRQDVPMIFGFDPKTQTQRDICLRNVPQILKPI
jgi:hypothetical protein